MFKPIGRTILWLRAQDYLRRYHPSLLGVTGSSGKTIAKDAITAVLSSSYRVRSSPLSYDSRIGIALSILGITARQFKRRWYKLLAQSKAAELTSLEPDMIVLSLGAAQPGDIDYVASRLAWLGAVITNVESTHLDLFTTKDLVAHELTSLIVSIPATGFIVLNGDDPLVQAMRPRSQARAIIYGTSPSAQVRLLHARRRARVGFACAVKIGGRLHELHFPNIVAETQILPIISALAVAHAMRLDMSQAIKSVQTIMPPPGHMRPLTGYNRAALLDDSYSASLENTLAALRTLGQYPARRRIAILGDMLNLGPQTINAHQQVGAVVADLANIFVAVGNNMRNAGAAALRQSELNSNTAPLDVHYFSSSRDVGKWLRDYLHPDDVILIKGSRAMHMEEVTRSLLANPADESQLVSSR